MVAIDRACRAAGGDAPVRAVYHALVEQPCADPQPLLERLAAIAAEQGDVARAVSAAQRDGRISPAERARIAAELLQLIAQATAALADVSPAAGPMRSVLGGAA